MVAREEGYKDKSSLELLDKCDWAFGPEQISLLPHYVPGMHELSTACVTPSSR